VRRKRRGGSLLHLLLLLLLLALELKGISKGSICKRFWGVSRNFMIYRKDWFTLWVEEE
jgi:hypothetical protein